MLLNGLAGPRRHYICMVRCRCVCIVQRWSRPLVRAAVERRERGLKLESNLHDMTIQYLLAYYNPPLQ